MFDLKYMHANYKKSWKYDQGYQLLGDRRSGSKLNSSRFSSGTSDMCYRFVLIRDGKKLFLYPNIEQEQNAATNL